MKINKNILPRPLKDFMENGRAAFRADDGDWNVKIESVADTPYKNDIPADALIIANNGCQDIPADTSNTAAEFCTS